MVLGSQGAAALSALDLIMTCSSRVVSGTSALLVVALAIAASASLAQGLRLVVKDAWVREAPASRPTSAAYMTIDNPSDREVVIVSASTPAARVVELHEMHDDNGRMRMRKVDKVVVAPRSRVELAPGGLHVMLFELTGPLVAQAKVTFTLALADGAAVTVEATVRGMAGSH